jgi:hypothetical protein
MRSRPDLHHFLVSRFPIPDASVTMIGGLAIDLTDRMKIEKTMVSARQQLLFRYDHLRVAGQIYSSLMHKFNNILNAISLRLALIKVEPEFGDENPGLRRLSNLVSDAAMTVRRLQGLPRFPDDRPLAHLDIAGAVREAASAVSTQMLQTPIERRAGSAWMECGRTFHRF